MKIYTRTGDRGETGLFAGPRVSKDDPRIEAYGTVDELNAWIGQVRSGNLDAEVDAILANVQHDLFVVGAELATPNPCEANVTRLDASTIAAIERHIDAFEAELEPLKQFILPGGSSEASALHVARTVCRRAERRIVALDRDADAPLSPTLIEYVNRLGDFLFVLARAVNARAGVSDVPWQKP